VVYLVDTVEVGVADVPAYLRVIETAGVPVMTGAGAAFVSCWSTSPELGEDVGITVVWSFEDHVVWNEIRKNLVLDQRWHAYAKETAALRKRGTRRFYYPADFSPLR
jgi:hypothetical protein